MRALVDDLDGRRRGLFVEAQARVEQYRKLARQRAEERKAAGEGVDAAAPDTEAEVEQAGEADETVCPTSENKAPVLVAQAVSPASSDYFTPFEGAIFRRYHPVKG